MTYWEGSPEQREYTQRVQELKRNPPKMEMEDRRDQCDTAPNGKHFMNLERTEIDGRAIVIDICIWCKQTPPKEWSIISAIDYMK